jgi:hypothetical protein
MHPPKRSQPGSPEKPHAGFNWPPTDDELAQYTLGIWAVQNAFDKPHADFNRPPPDEELGAHGIDAVQSEAAFDEIGVRTAEPSVAPPSLPASSEPQYDLSDGPQRDEGPTPSDADDSTHSGVWCSRMSAIAGAQSDTALDGTWAREWTAEIARLQALIEELTEPLEWRITNVTAYERRPKP